MCYFDLLFFVIVEKTHSWSKLCSFNLRWIWAGTLNFILFFCEVFGIQPDWTLSYVTGALYTPHSFDCGRTLEECSAQGALKWIGDKSTFVKPDWIGSPNVYYFDGNQISSYGFDLAIIDGQNYPHQVLCKMSEKICEIGKNWSRRI